MRRTTNDRRPRLALSLTPTRLALTSAPTRLAEVEAARAALLASWRTGMDASRTRALFDVLERETPQLQLEQLVLGVARAFSVPVIELLGRRRSRSVVRARHALCLLLARRLDLSSPEIGRILGRHHVTVLHSWAVAARLERDETSYAERLVAALK